MKTTSMCNTGSTSLGFILILCAVNITLRDGNTPKSIKLGVIPNKMHRYRFVS